MSTAAKQSIIILVILIFAAAGFAGNTFIQKQQLEKDVISLEKQIDDYQTREKTYITDYKTLENKYKDIEDSKNNLEKKLSSFDGDIEDLDGKIQGLTDARDKWKKRVDDLREERNSLLVKLQEKPQQEVIYKYIEKKSGVPSTSLQVDTQSGAMSNSSPTYAEEEDESYWAKLLKEKVAIELEVEGLKQSLSKNALQVESYKKENADLQMQINKLSNERDEIQREIKNGNNLADILSLQLARAQNDKRFLKDRLAKINGTNTQLQQHIKELTSTKLALENSIVQIQTDKKEVEKKLFETENIIQSRIDEIWEIKDSIEKSFSPTQVSEISEKTGIELAPIIINAQKSETTMDMQQKAMLMNPGFDGNIVSVNDENNFVIVDIGENSGVKLGDSLNVYRGSEYIAGLEIIQVRQDIAAADIKNRVAEVRIGDEVR